MHKLPVYATQMHKLPVYATQMHKLAVYATTFGLILGLLGRAGPLGTIVSSLILTLTY